MIAAFYEKVTIEVASPPAVARLVYEEGGFGSLKLPNPPSS